MNRSLCVSSKGQRKTGHNLKIDTLISKIPSERTDCCLPPFLAARHPTPLSTTVVYTGLQRCACSREWCTGGLLRCSHCPLKTSTNQRKVEAENQLAKGRKSQGGGDSHWITSLCTSNDRRMFE